MLAKTILVMWLLAGRGSVEYQYALRFENEQDCQRAAAQIESKVKAWNAYPVQHANCVVDATPLLPKSQTTRK